MKIEAKIKEWGNSMGIIIQKDIVDELKIKPGESVLIDIEKKENSFKELFGALKFKKSTKELIKDARKELNSKWM